MGQPPLVKARGPYRKIEEGTWGTETSKYPEEKTSYEIPSVAASESGRG